MSCFIHIRTAKFPKPSADEVALSGYQYYGKEFADFLQMSFSLRGYTADLPIPDEDSWFIELKPGISCPMHIRAYIIPPGETELAEFICTYDVEKRSVWNWKKFKKISTEPWRENIEAHLLDIFNKEDGIEIVCIAPGMNEILAQSQR